MWVLSVVTNKGFVERGERMGCYLEVLLEEGVGVFSLEFGGEIG
jgi:hypothetical protein